MRELVIAGPKNYPGATMVEYEDGRQQSLVYSGMCVAVLR
jgi:hypothetical protein